MSTPERRNEEALRNPYWGEGEYPGAHVPRIPERDDARGPALPPGVENVLPNPYWGGDYPNAQ